MSKFKLDVHLQVHWGLKKAKECFWLACMHLSSPLE
eukprot:CAMPEP_0202389648 /NCGR_PEP_ID=MMETSP1127-20130417/84299_1 /ASSEMBLY_ACC=CAM_ASM_000462 /TAXON_ID=3047 /ORGANISM="Dunaliella tertiolecta, Strain CCMP1320" /LENGTH=35 /DNA_ID= /DNA_START= /DNA_END= /DNA_ORIENTATION=